MSQAMKVKKIEEEAKKIKTSKKDEKALSKKKRPGKVLGSMAEKDSAVTERKRVEEALRESEMRFRELFNRMSSGVTVYEAVDNGGDFIFMDFNPAAEKIEKVSRKDILGKRVSEVFPGVKEFGVFQVFQRVWQTGKPEYYPENIYKDERDSGSWRESWVFKLPTGEIVAIYNDVTERKRAESQREAALEALKKSSQLLRATGEMAKVGGWELDLSTQKVSWTEEVARIHGVEPGYRLKLQEALNFYPPEFRPALEAALKKAAETGEPYDLESHFIPQGSKDWIWVRSLGRAVYSDGKITKLAGTFQNIDKYKRAEEALRENEEKYRLVFNNFVDLYYQTDMQGLITNLSPSCFVLSGYQPEELIGCQVLDFYTDSKQRKTFLKKLFRDGAVSDFEITLLHRDGRHIPASVSSHLIRNEQGDLKYIEGIIRDITERKQAESQREVALDALQAALEGKEVLLKEVHHRVKNNLTAIIGLLQLQQETVTDPAVVAQFRELEGRISSMALVHETLYHIESLARIDLQKYLETLIDQLRAALDPRGDVRFSVTAAGVEMGLDNAVPCGLILNELLTNAFKYAFPGNQPRPGEKACVITVAAQWDSGAKDGGVYTLTVADNGVGLPVDLDWATTKTLGLRLVRMLGQYQLKGQIELDRANGTSFRLVFASRQMEQRG